MIKYGIFPCFSPTEIFDFPQPNVAIYSATKLTLIIESRDYLMLDFTIDAQIIGSLRIPRINYILPLRPKPSNPSLI